MPTITAQQIAADDTLRIEFTTVAEAVSFIYQTEHPADWARVLGDNGKIWVLSAQHAQILLNAGYQYVC